MSRLRFQNFLPLNVQASYRLHDPMLLTDEATNLSGESGLVRPEATPFYVGCILDDMLPLRLEVDVESRVGKPPKARNSTEGNAFRNDERWLPLGIAGLVTDDFVVCRDRENRDPLTTVLGPCCASDTCSNLTILPAWCD